MKPLTSEIFKKFKREFDQNAESSQEMAHELGFSVTWVRNLVKEKLQSGEWEQVWKKVNGRVVPAYRKSTKRA